MKSMTLAAVLLLATAPRPAMAQSPAQDHAQIEMMGDAATAGKHLVLTPLQPGQPGDQARANSLVAVAREALEKYADVAVAEAAGYHMFAPKVKQQKIYHYSNRANARKARNQFDPTAPTALLYEPQSNGQLRLIGAMYTAPASASLEELNARIPLSVAQWHEHTSICLPPGAATDLGLATRDSRFGPRGSIATESACEAAGGTFKPRMLSWMVHVNVFQPPDQVWVHKH